MEDRRYKSNLRTLRILLVISFVVTGYFLLSELVMGLSQPMMKARFEQDPETFLAPLYRVDGTLWKDVTRYT